jgi:hypothetical protein
MRYLMTDWDVRWRRELTVLGWLAAVIALLAAGMIVLLLLFGQGAS